MKVKLLRSYFLPVRLKPCPGVWTFAGGARPGVRRLDAAFPAEHAWLADAAPLAKTVATLPHSKAQTLGPRRARPKPCPDTAQSNSYLHCEPLTLAFLL